MRRNELQQVGRYDHATQTFHVETIPAPPVGGVFARAPIDQMNRDMGAEVRLCAACPHCLRPIEFGWYREISERMTLGDVQHDPLARMAVGELVQRTDREVRDANALATARMYQADDARAEAKVAAQAANRAQAELKKLRKNTRKRRRHEAKARKATP